MFSLLSSVEMFVLQGSGMPVLAVMALWSNVWPYLAILAGFSLIVFVHELGHFAVAKWADVRVERFAIGFGRELFGFTRGETRYSFNMLPLGGYVKMLGQEDFDDKAQELKFKDDPRSFVNKSVGRRVAIVSAGVVMNLLFAFFMFMIVFMVGMEAISPRIAQVMPDSPAARAGIEPGDTVTSINGNRIREFNEISFSVLLAPPHEQIEFTVDRGGQQHVLYIQPEADSSDAARGVSRLIVGISPGLTPEIIGVGPEIDTTRTDRPHPGDKLLRVAGVDVTADNVNHVFQLLAHADEPVLVERTDDATQESAEVEVRIPPILSIYPTDPRDPSTVNVLGLTPLVRVGMVEPKRRADLAGIEVGDTIEMWDDIQYPTQAQILRSIRRNAEWDIPFRVRKADGRVWSHFMRPELNKRGAVTIQAMCETIDSNAAGAGMDAPKNGRHPEDGEDRSPRSRLSAVRPGGTAALAGLENGDVVVSVLGNQNPSCNTLRRVVRSNPGKAISLVARNGGGEIHRTWVYPAYPGSIDAGFSLVADDVMRTGAIVRRINGVPSPAAVAGIPAGAKILAIDDEPIERWRDLIDAFRRHAGDNVALRYQTDDGIEKSTAFPIPHSIRTLLGIGPEGRIVRVDGQDTFVVQTTNGEEHMSVRYREGLRSALAGMVGRTVEIEYRRRPLAELETASVEVRSDMVDPWLGRISYTPNIRLADATLLLKGENALDAIGIGVHKTYYFIAQVYLIMKRMFFTRSVGFDNVSGPLGIIDIGGNVARAGLIKFLYFLAMISANLAVINFLPLPIVDGGLMVFLLIEKIKGSPVSLRIQVATQMIGIVLIVGIFIAVTYQDALRMFG